MDLMTLMQKQTNMVLTKTANGADAYATSGSYLLDFNYLMSSMRNMGLGEFFDLYTKVWSEDPMLAIKIAFYAGDIRFGLGEREVFRRCMLYIATWHSEIAKAVMELIPEYNRWDSVLPMYSVAKTKEAAVRMIRTQLHKDMNDMFESKPISLCAKWMPSVNASSFQTVVLAKELAQDLGMSERRYRKTLSALRKYLNVVEVKMSAKEWGDINYERVPSRANLLYSDAFIRNDPIRRGDYLHELAQGKKKINAGVLYPHEIVNKLQRLAYVAEDDELAVYESMWKALPDYGVRNTLVVRDGSGSMKWFKYNGSQTTPYDVATALAIYLSEHNSGAWKDKYITFSSHPEIVDMRNCNTLAEKVRLSHSYDDLTNTDMYQTMMLVLNTSLAYGVPASEMPEMIVILSDMQFDADAHDFNGSLFDSIKRKFEENGYALPKICFWNLNGNSYRTIPMQENDMGLVLGSGFTPNTINMFMSGDFKDPYDILVNALNSDRYKPVEEAVKGLL